MKVSKMVSNRRAGEIAHYSKVRLRPVAAETSELKIVSKKRVEHLRFFSQGIFQLEKILGGGTVKKNDKQDL